MRLPRLTRVSGAALAAAPVFLCGLPVERSPVGSGGERPAAGIRATLGGSATPTDYGDCGPGARRETGVQGEVPYADQRSGASKAGYRCNFRLVGQNTIRDRGANFDMDRYRNCAYVGSVGVRELQGPADELDGVAVIDASDERRPRLVKVVRSAVGRSQHEGIEVNQRRGMLVVQTGGLVARYIDVYDVSRDCRDPVFKGRFDAGTPIYHGQKISDDGRTIYASDFTGVAGLGQVLHAIDVTDMTKPRLLKRWDPLQEQPARTYGIHDLELSADGNRAYVGAVHVSADLGALVLGGPSNTGPSVVTLDVSEIQARRPNPDVKVISDIGFPNFGHAITRARIGGKPYLIASGETPFGGQKNCPWAWGNLVDMSDERHPREAGELKLAVNLTSNCRRVGPGNGVYSIHYAEVDDERDATTVFYTYYTGGVRAFDIRDPEHPKEIGYYHPPPRPATRHAPLPIFAGDNQTPAWDSATSRPSYDPRTRRLWFASIGGGFQIIELTTPQARGSARVLRQRATTAARRRAVRVAARCTMVCTLTLDLKLAGRQAGRRTVRFAAAGRRVVSIPLGRRSARRLRLRPRLRASVVGVVRDRDGGRRVHRFRTRARRIG
jgi:hypothetical protein